MRCQFRDGLNAHTFWRQFIAYRNLQSAYVDGFQQVHDLEQGLSFIWRKRDSSFPMNGYQLYGLALFIFPGIFPLWLATFRRRNFHVSKLWHNGGTCASPAGIFDQTLLGFFHVPVVSAFLSRSKSLFPMVFASALTSVGSDFASGKRNRRF